MFEEEVLVLIYRSLRDSISSNIAYVDYDEKDQNIYLTLKGNMIPYPDKGSVEALDENPTFNGSIWKINKDGISDCSAQKNLPVKKTSWIKKLFG